jgi:hypothetical protein
VSSFPQDVLCGTFITYQTNTLSAAIFEMPNTPAT